MTYCTKRYSAIALDPSWPHSICHRVFRKTNAQVPSSRLILIHPGNKPQDTEGCLLPGTNRNINEVTQSVILYEKLKCLMIKNGIHNFKVFIMSCYVDHGNQSCR
ncbi:DUF5675 family protein [Mixta theicola]|uniref:DUF5675 family protein n=1 Tax=Mixta theicola TaxID=1458355 RepID=UPI003908B21B